MAENILEARNSYFILMDIGNNLRVMSWGITQLEFAL